MPGPGCSTHRGHLRRATTPADAGSSMRQIELRSDNAGGVAPEILAAVAAANTGSALAYGADDWTARLQQIAAEVVRTSRRHGVPGGERNGGQLAVTRRALPTVGCRAVSRVGAHRAQRVRGDVDVLGWRRHARAARRWLPPRRRLASVKRSQPPDGEILTIRNPPCCRSPLRRISVPCIPSRASRSSPRSRRREACAFISTVRASPTPSPRSAARLPI